MSLLSSATEFSVSLSDWAALQIDDVLAAGLFKSWFAIFRARLGRARGEVQALRDHLLLVRMWVIVIGIAISTACALFNWFQVFLFIWAK